MRGGEAAPRPRSWREMRENIERILERRTGDGLDVWNRRLAELGELEEQRVRAWLEDNGVAGYPQMLLLMERFGYPDYLLASADELIDQQYADRAALRAVLDALLLRAVTVGTVDVQARKTYVTLVSPRRTFALIKPSTRTRLDLGLRLPEVEPSGRVEAAHGLGNDYITARIALRSVDDVDDEVGAWLQRAYDLNA